MNIDEAIAALRDVRRFLVISAEQARLDGKAEMADGYREARDRVSEAIENIEWAAKQ